MLPKMYFLEKIQCVETFKDFSYQILINTMYENNHFIFKND